MFNHQVGGSLEAALGGRDLARPAVTGSRTPASVVPAENESAAHYNKGPLCVSAFIHDVSDIRKRRRRKAAGSNYASPSPPAPPTPPQLILREKYEAAVRVKGLLRRLLTANLVGRPSLPPLPPSPHGAGAVTQVAA